MCPQDYYDSAAIDGGSRWQIFRWITLPLLTPWLLLLTIRDIILSAQNTFTPAWLMTKGGPYYATLFLPMFIYNEAFDRFLLRPRGRDAAGHVCVDRAVALDALRRLWAAGGTPAMFSALVRNPGRLLRMALYHAVALAVTALFVVPLLWVVAFSLRQTAPAAAAADRVDSLAACAGATTRGSSRSFRWACTCSTR